MSDYYANMELRTTEFRTRIEVDGREFCESLFRHAGVRLMACKYAYYVKNNPFVEDIAYDGDEKGWFIMGRALGLLKEDETSPCVDWDEKHPLADEGRDMAERLMR